MPGLLGSSTAALASLSSHAVFLVLLQLALLLFVARVAGEIVKWLGLPSVVGELAAGIVLGPTVFGHFAPQLSARVFPMEAGQFHLLETIGTLGMVLLLLLTGIETDLKLVKNLGRAAVVASIMGMVIPFAMGLGLGLVMPDAYLAQPERRLLFGFFLATTLSISAMPVIAKILIDLDLTKRNIGMVILSAGVVDDTAGWLILSVIAGAATSGGTVDVVGILETIGFLVAFLVGAVVVVFPVSRFLLRVSERFRSTDADLSIIFIITLLSAALTEKIGVHAVFGAFVAGTIFRQVPQLKEETVHKLESFVMAVLAPIFFGVVGLKVDLWALGGGGMLAIVIGVACLGKILGCTLGGLWGGLRIWEALSIAVAMNARGAMGLVAASIGLSLGILNQQMFSIIVMVAISTSFLAPLLLKLTMRRVRMTDEEALRILESQSKGALDPLRLRLLVPTAGGPNAIEAMRLAAVLDARSDEPITILYVETRKQTWWEKFLAPIAKGERPDQEKIEAHLGVLKQIAEGESRASNLPSSQRSSTQTPPPGSVGKSTAITPPPSSRSSRAPTVRRVSSADVAEAIVMEARKGAHLVLMGASQRGAMLGGGVLQTVVEQSPCHVAIMRAHPGATSYTRLFVPVDGGAASRLAAEFAVRYAEGSGAELTLALLTEQSSQRTKTPSYLAEPRLQSHPSIPPPPATSARPPDEELHRISVVFRTTQVKPNIVRLAADPASSALSTAVASGGHDLVILGAEHRAIQSRLFFGHDTERLIQHSDVALVVVVPNIAMLR